MNDSIIFIDKPKGITSFDVIRRLRRKTGIKKMGHAGTLDPNATGLMIVGIGHATKELTHYIKLDKVYDAVILFGISTDTGDIDGKIIQQQDIASLDKEKLLNITNFMQGNLNLQVPIYSAIKRNGKALYKYAREGKKHIMAPHKDMYIYWAKFNSLNKKENKFYASISFKVKSGTYIRSLVTYIGEQLNCPSTLYDLRRVQIGDHIVDEAIKL